MQVSPEKMFFKKLKYKNIMKQKQVAVKGKFTFKGSDGNECELGFIIPGEVSSKIFKDILDWKETWLWTAKEYEEYQESEKYFLAELKDK